jgi:carboxyl-terminal processing protease
MLTDGSALRLTIAKYYTPSGRCIQRSYKNGTESYYHDVLARFSHGELENKDSISFKDTTKYYTSKGRVVYGGGGIMPDVFVPLDTTYQSALLRKVEDEGLLQEFAYRYTFSNNNPDVNTIDKTKLAVDFSRFLLMKNISWKDADWNKSSAYMLNQITAYIARGENGDNAYYKISNATDNTVQKAIGVLEK